MKSSNKKILKSKTKIKEILDDPMINRNNRDENMKQIKKFFVILEIIFSNQKRIIINPQEMAMLLVVITLNMKVMETKAQYYLLKTWPVLIWSGHI